MTCKAALGIGIAMAVLACGNGAIRADETLVVPADSSAGVNTQPLLAGKTYVFEASGTYVWGPSSEIADAEWSWVSKADHTWVETRPEPWAPTLHMDVVVDGNGVDWQGKTGPNQFAIHTYSPEHVYRYTMVGTGAPVNLKIMDTTYTDNSGGVTVHISQVPEPATLSLLALAGLAAIRRKRK